MVWILYEWLKSLENKAALFACKWKNTLGKVLNVVEVVAFDYPCEFPNQLLCHFCFMLF